MIKEYLDRIKYSGQIYLDSKTLIALHKAHVSSIPFENISLMMGEKIDLSKHFLFHKIIEQKRGGICYELNYLFYELLRSFGFKVRIVSAKTKYGNEYGGEFDHMALVVDIDNKSWLVDVGLREALWYPIDISRHVWSKQNTKSYSVFRDILENYHLLKLDDVHIYEEYKFSLSSQQPQDFSTKFNFHEKNPKSPLNRYLICCIETKLGRLVINGNRIILHERDGVREITILDDKCSFSHIRNACKLFGFETSLHEKIFHLIHKHQMMVA